MHDRTQQVGEIVRACPMGVSGGAGGGVGGGVAQDDDDLQERSRPVSSQQLRDRLHRQIDALPESALIEVSDFVPFLLARHEAAAGSGIGDWIHSA